MWRTRQAQVDARRDELVARSRSLRERLGREAQPLERPFELADRVREGVRWLAVHPLWLAVAAAVPVLLRPRRAAGWGVKLWWGWRMWRRLRAVLAASGPS